MEETLRQVLSVTIGMLCALFGTGCLSILAIRFWRWVPTVGLWRLKRATIVVLGDLTSFYFNEINAVMNELLPSSGYSLNTLDLSNYETISPYE